MLNVFPNAITRPPLNQKEWKQINYAFVTKTTSQLRISALFILSFAGIGREVKSFLIKSQAEVAPGDAQKVSHV